MRYVLSMIAVLVLSTGTGIAQDAYKPDVPVDTGSHTCTHQGQDWNVSHVYEAPPGYHFTENNWRAVEVSKFGAGSCTIEGVRRVPTQVTFPSGRKGTLQLVTGIAVRAYADCTNDFGRIGSRVGTECRLEATTERYD
jgi:hypothetical protein